MRKITKSILLLTSAVCLSSSQLSAVETDPVGYVTLTANGTGGVGNSAVSILGAPLENPVEATGVITAVDGATITSGASEWSPATFSDSHYVRIVSGPNSGITASISGNTATTLTTAQDLSSVIASGDRLEIRPYTTLADVFGPSNEAGIGSGATVGEADEVLVFNGVGFDIYYYQEGAQFGGSGFRSSTNAFTDASGTTVAPGQAIVYKRKSDGSLSIVFSGSVLSSDTFVPVDNGVNLISGAHPITYSLASYFGANGGDLTKGATVSEADEILITNASGGFDIYYYQEGAAFGGSGFRSSTNAFTDASSTEVMGPGEGFVLKRKSTAFNQLDETPLDDIVQ